MTATDLARAIRTRAVSAVEVMEACLARIKRINPKVNAICTLVDEDSLLQQARKPTSDWGNRPGVGPLHGLPHAVKDLVPTAGIRTTYGSPMYKDNIPTEDAMLVERIRRPARSSSARPTRRNSVQDRRRSTRSSARRAIPTI